MIPRELDFFDAELQLSMKEGLEEGLSLKEGLVRAGIGWGAGIRWSSSGGSVGGESVKDDKGLICLIYAEPQQRDEGTEITKGQRWQVQCYFKTMLNNNRVILKCTLAVHDLAEVDMLLYKNYDPGMFL